MECGAFSVRIYDKNVAIGNVAPDFFPPGAVGPAFDVGRFNISARSENYFVSLSREIGGDRFGLPLSFEKEAFRAENSRNLPSESPTFAQLPPRYFGKLPVFFEITRTFSPESPTLCLLKCVGKLNMLMFGWSKAPKNEEKREKRLPTQQKIVLLHADYYQATP